MHGQGAADRLHPVADHGLAFEVPGEGGYEEWRRRTNDPDQLLVGVPIVAARGQLPGS